MIGISHIALNVSDLDVQKSFYTHYFNGKASPHYHNPRTGLETCFIQFEDGGRLELMHWKGSIQRLSGTKVLGFIHLAFSVGSKEAVDLLTLKMRNADIKIISGPRPTGDGYYETLLEDPEGNLVEVTV
ncbi:MAG: VOC family protein [Anaerolineaceae bacterium]|nr:VOC family protein [Anaerolineaceae bacterium]